MDKTFYKDVVKDNPCSSIIIYGCRRAGKSQLARSFIIEKKMLFDWADITVVFCQGINIDAYTTAGIDKQFIYHEWREDVVMSLIEMQKEYKQETNKLLNIWIIVDDVLSSRRNKSKAINSERGIEYLFSTCRHYNINITVLTQSMKYCSMLYQNADMIFCFPHHIRKQSDREEFVKEIIKPFTDDESIFYDCKPHEFLFMHLTADTDKFIYDVNIVNEKIIKFKI